jgi:hypothetical protein
VRAELLLDLAELADPRATAKWLAPDPNGPIIGMKQTMHFFFDDHDFDNGAIGWSLFDDREVRAIDSLKVAIESVFLSDRGGDDAAYLSSPLWQAVVHAAREAHALFGEKGHPVWKVE